MVKPALHGLEEDLFGAGYDTSAKLHPAVRRFLEQVGGILSEAEKPAAGAEMHKTPDNNAPIIDVTPPVALTPEQISLIEEQERGELAERAEEAWKAWLVNNNHGGARPAPETIAPAASVSAQPPPPTTHGLEIKSPAARDVASATSTKSAVSATHATDSFTGTQLPPQPRYVAAVKPEVAATKNTQPAETQIQLPQELAFTHLLQSHIGNVDAAYRKRITRHALRLLGTKPEDQQTYSYGRVRAYETFTSAVGKLAEKKSVSAGLIDSLGMLDVSDPDVMVRFNESLENAAGNPSAISGILSGIKAGLFSPDKTKYPVKQRRPSAEQTQPHLYGVQRSEPSVRAPQISDIGRFTLPPIVKNTAYYLSALDEVTKNLPPGRREIARSYMMRALGVDSADATLAQGERMDLTDDFLRLVRSGVALNKLPKPFYTTLGKFNGSDPEEMKKFQRAIRLSAGDPEKIMMTLAEYLDSGELYDAGDGLPEKLSPGSVPGAIQKKYARVIKSVDELYTEDPDMVAVVSKAQGFADDMVAARNALVADHTGDGVIKNFYGAMKTISGYGMNRGSVYRDVLRLMRSSPMVGRVLVNWMSEEDNLSMQELDKELGKYTAIGPRFYEK